jgi:hypothetical protein
VVETERHLFLRKHIITLLPTASIKLSATEYVESYHFSLLPSHLLLLLVAPILHHTRWLRRLQPIPPVDDAGNDSASKSVARAASSSPTRGATLMADRKTPKMFGFFKKTTVTDAKCQGYHDLGWLIGNLLSSIPEVDFPTVDGSIVLCFESHLNARLGLPHSKFLVSIMNFLGCSLIHFNPNALAAFSSFAMLCEC